jgi:hypothetical protein
MYLLKGSLDVIKSGNGISSIIKSEDTLNTVAVIIWL